MRNTNKRPSLLWAFILACVMALGISVSAYADTSPADLTLTASESAGETDSTSSTKENSGADSGSGANALDSNVIVVVGAVLVLSLIAVGALFIVSARRRKVAIKYHAVNNVELYDNLKEIEWDAPDSVQLKAPVPDEEILEDAPVELKSRFAIDQRIKVTEKLPEQQLGEYTMPEDELSTSFKLGKLKTYSTAAKDERYEEEKIAAPTATVSEAPGEKRADKKRVGLSAIKPLTERMVTETPGDLISVVSVPKAEEVLTLSKPAKKVEKSGVVRPASQLTALNLDLFVVEKSDEEVHGRDVEIQKPKEETTVSATAPVQKAREYDAFVTEKPYGEILGAKSEPTYAPKAAKPEFISHKDYDSYLVEKPDHELLGEIFNH